MPPPQRLYESPPGSGSNDGALPTSYDPTWPSYTNLTPQQILAFQTFPQDLVKYALLRRWLAEITTMPVTMTVQGASRTLQIDMSDRGQARIDKLARKWGSNATATTAFVDTTGTIFNLSAANLMTIDNAVTALVEQLHTELATLMSGINVVPPTVTTRKAIDAAYAAIVPNSPSGINPSPT